jgi:DNA modification methylase
MWIFGTYHNIGIINVICQKLGIEIINEVVWYKRNAFPNLSGRRLTASHETILWCNKGDKKREYYFDYDYAKESGFAEDGLKTAGKQMRTVWDIPNNKRPNESIFGKHPTQKPLRVLERIIHLSSKEGDLVMTPFSGAGSECVAAKLAGRNYLGFEVDEEYYDISVARLAGVELSSQISLLDVFESNMEGDE